jgi:hypothetical protein
LKNIVNTLLQASTNLLSKYIQTKLNIRTSHEITLIIQTEHQRRILCLTKHHAMKKYGGSGGIASRILNLGTRWR